MKKRGAGWIPDYPDQSDYSLNFANAKLSDKVQSQGTAASIENLAKTMRDTLKALSELEVSDALKALSELDFSDDTKQLLGKLTEDTKQRLGELTEDIEKEILDGVEFITVDFYEAFKKGSVSSEVLNITGLLSLFKSNYPYFSKKIFESMDLDPVNDLQNLSNTLTQPALQAVQKLLERQLVCIDRHKQDSPPKDSIHPNEIHFLRRLLAYKIYGNSLLHELNDWEKYLKENDLKDHREALKTFSKDETLNLELNKQLEFIRFVIEANISNDLVGFFEKFTQYFKPSKNYGFSDTTPINNVTVERLWEDTINEVAALKNSNSGEDYGKKLRGFWKLFDGISNSSPQPDNRVLSIDDLAINSLSMSSTFSDFYIRDVEDVKAKLKKILNVIIKAFYNNHLPQFLPSPFNPPELPVESPIHSDLVRLLWKQLIQEERLSSNIDYVIISELTKPIVDVVAQMLMPLGQYSNLSDAVDKALAKIKRLMEQEDFTTKSQDHSSSKESALIDGSNLQKSDLLALQQMIQEMLRQQASPLSKEVAPVDDSSLYNMTLSALRQIEGMLKQEYPDTDGSIICSLFKNCLWSKLIDKIKEETNDQSLELKPRIPFFRVELSDISSTGGQKDQSSERESTSTRRQQIQFPMTLKLRKKIKELSPITDPDQKDLPINQAEYQAAYNQKFVDLTLPEFVDLSYWFSPVEDQGNLNSCTAHAGTALIEYAQNKISGTYTNSASTLFLYKVTRNLMQQEGDAGASMRDTMKAMVAFGVCPEEYWPYDESKFDQEPTGFSYAFAENYKTLKYFRVDHGTISKSTLLAQVKVLLASEIPCAFGFTLYSSVYEDSNFELGHIPLPTSRDKVVGGHVVVAVGYHDRKIIKNSNGDQFEGALLIRNSWGSRWGQGGYGWIPYEYVIKGLTADWWSLLKAEWLASGSFGAGASAWDRSSGGGPDGGHPPTL
jgi:C1A family cysteine protease